MTTMDRIRRFLQRNEGAALETPHTCNYHPMQKRVKPSHRA